MTWRRLRYLLKPTVIFKLTKVFNIVYAITGVIHRRCSVPFAMFLQNSRDVVEDYFVKVFGVSWWRAFRVAGEDEIYN
jgi:hypothetical protein